jgi:hypothetical protein
MTEEIVIDYLIPERVIDPGLGELTRSVILSGLSRKEQSQLDKLTLPEPNNELRLIGPLPQDRIDIGC